MSFPVVAAVFLYLIGMGVLTIWLRRRVATDEDYLLAGRRMRGTLVGITLLAAHIGGAFVLGTSQDAYSMGFAALSLGIGVLLGLGILAAFVAKPARAGGYSTVPEILGKRYRNPLMSRAASILAIAALTGLLSAQVNAAASAFASLGLPHEWGAVLSAVLFIVFSVWAGMWGVAITDAIQFTVIVVGLVVVLFFALPAAGGFGAIAEAFQAGGVAEPFNPLNQGLPFLLGISLPAAVHQLVGQDVLQRIFSARSGRDAAVGAWICGVLTFGFAAVPALIGMSARVLYPHLDPSVGVVPTLIKELLPGWVSGILIAAILSAVISSADALLLTAVTNIQHDFLSRIARVRDDARLQLVLSRAITVVLGVLAYLFSQVLPGIIEVLVAALTIYGSGVFVPFMWGLFTKRWADWRAALAALITGSVVALLGILHVYTVPQVPEILLGVAASALVFFVVGALTRGGRADVANGGAVEDAAGDAIRPAQSPHSAEH